jgi:hypothetical protein
MFEYEIDPVPRAKFLPDGRNSKLVQHPEHGTLKVVYAWWIGPAFRQCLGDDRSPIFGEAPGVAGDDLSVVEL